MAPTTKLCVRCATVKPLTEFHGIKQKHSWCKPCFVAYKKTRPNYETAATKKRRQAKERDQFAANPEAMYMRRRAWLADKPERTRKYYLKSILGDDAVLVDSLPNQCAICGSAKNICVDHDHKTRRLRGKLCAACNKGLGFFRDNPQLLRDAIAYLQQPPAQTVPDARIAIA